MQSLVLVATRKHDKVRDGVFLEQSMPIDRRAAGMHQASTPLENCEICDPRHVDHGQGGIDHKKRAG